MLLLKDSHARGRRLSRGARVAAVALAACASLASPTPVSTNAPETPKAPAARRPAADQSQGTPGIVVPPPANGPYRLAEGDVVDIRLFYNAELNDQVQIRPDGRISMPLIGEVELAGKTIAEAVTQLEERYAKEVRTPRVTIQVRTYAAQKVFVTGEVMRPGVVNLPGRMTVLEAIHEAGGIRHTGNTKLAVLIRKRADGQPIGYRLPLVARGAPTPQAATVLGPFDVVMVPETRIARVDRWVDQHIRQLIPFTLSAGFAYVLNKNQGGGSTVVPIF